MSDLSKDITALVERIDSMPDNSRAEILNGLLAKKAERQRYAGTVLLTPNMAAARDERCKPILYQLECTCERYGYPIDGDSLIDLNALTAAFKKNNAPNNVRWDVKTTLAAIGLVR
jgi:hypothetical protein